MKKIWLTLVLLMFLIPSTKAAEANGLQAAFIRDKALWLYMDGSEVLLQENLSISNLGWSKDGQWLSFEEKSETEGEEPAIWLYHVPTNTHTKLKMVGHDVQWNPKKNSFAFLTGSFLSVVEFKDNKPIIHQLNGGVSHFSWDAEGENLIASASAVMFPDGWSHPRLYEVKWDAEHKNQELDVKVEPLLTISSPLKLDDLSILSIDAENFNWSKDGKLLAFVVSPTASWSEDSNMLTVFVKENKVLIPMGEILREKGWIKWAPSKSHLASIQGGGRLRGGVKNKRLTVQSVLPSQTKIFTPDGFADVNFDWLDDTRIVVARGKESDTLADFRSGLILINSKEDEQKSSGKPFVDLPEGFSDEKPVTLKKHKMLSWIRTDANGWKSVWMSGLDGSDARKLIEGVNDVKWFDEG
ncbi:hypothetical protein JOC95_001965 [Bacillus tianshenii]|uniref:Uncharacterized protein n=1 Tax=Sutcliffiella tianshenii TaxID=1463404 RepID=A0ABS2NZH5_9BACI|nr:hypothetical protein [Bacillus tianshenii]MBM7620112.1 hypothetical protein [Bacillus tianshenii]